jgi:hypothetical protein
MSFEVCAKAAVVKSGVAVPGKARAPAQAGGLRPACNATWGCNRGLFEGLTAKVTAAASPRWGMPSARDNASKIHSTF